MLFENRVIPEGKLSLIDVSLESGVAPIIAFIEESAVIHKILQHLGLWERSPRSPPPRLFPHKLEAFLASLTAQQAQRVRACTESIFWDDVPVHND